MNKTFSCVVGFNHTDLIGARADALKVARALFLYGVDEEEITIFVDHQASLSTLNNYFNEIKTLVQKSDQLFFYYAGHGSNDGESYLQLADANLSLALLIQMIAEVPARHAFVVIDACHIMLNRIDFQFQKVKLGGMFLLFPGQNSYTYEDKISGSGEFTHLFLASLADISPIATFPFAELLQQLRVLCLKHSLDMPDYYQLGRQEGYFLPSFKESMIKNQLVHRTASLKKIQDFLSKQVSPIVWIWGSAGHGKSILAKQICSGPTTSIYTTALKQKSFSESVLHSLFMQIPGQLPHVYPQEKWIESSPEEAFFSLQRKEPNLVWIIDHLERLDANSLLELIKSISKIDLPILLISRFPPSKHIESESKERLIEWQPPRFSLQETEQMMKIANLPYYDATSLHLSCDGNPLKLKRVLIHLTQNESEQELDDENFKKALTALYVIGPYLDEQLLCAVCDVKFETIDRLHKIGFIGACNNIFYPHDILYEAVENENLKLDVNLAVNYWVLQVDETPKSIHACRSLLFTVSHLEIEVLPIRSILIALKTLRGKENRTLLIDLAESLEKRKPIRELVVPVIQELIDYEIFDTAENLIRFLQEIAPKMSQLFSAEIACWKGDFLEAIEISSCVLKDAYDSDVIAYAHANIALPQFFLGNWELSKTHLEIILNIDVTIDIKLRGWAECILGTILAIRGENVERGKSLLLKSIESFEQCQNSNWLSISWNNLGEVLWKVGKYAQAIEALKKAKEIVEITKNLVMHIEILRNMIQVFLRKEGASCLVLYDLMCDVESLAIHSNDSFEKMQYLNTFATVYAYKNDLVSLEKTLNELFVMTQNNHEYHIYTLANFALFHGLQNQIESARQYFDQAISLAKKGQNYLAIRQILEDAQNCGITCLSLEVV